MTYTYEGSQQADWERSQHHAASAYPQPWGHEAAAQPGWGQHATSWGSTQNATVQPEPAGDATPSHDPIAAEIRNLVLDRLQRMSFMHGMHAWDLRRSAKPLGPHALAFFYRDMLSPGDHHNPPRYRVAAATRLFSDGEDVRDVAGLLGRLTNLARQRYLVIWDFDPRRTMADRQDEMTPRAEYLGVGMSTLDTPAGGWEQVKEYAGGPLDVAGRCYALLTDGTAMILDREGNRNFGAVSIKSTQDLNVIPGIPPRVWQWMREADRQVYPRDLWHRLQELHEVVLEGVWQRSETVRRTNRHH